LDAGASTSDKTKEETLFEYVDKPSFLRNLYSRVSEVTEKKTTIVVDSLEALKSNLGISESDLRVERDILEIGERTKSNVIFVSELAGESRLDYLVDGVVRLEKEIVNNRLLRKLYIEKVRGKVIESPVYLFTLKDGRFRCFKRGIQTSFVHAELPKFEKREKIGKIPTLVKEFDELLGGGFERGSFNIFDVGDKVGVNHAYILTPMFFNILLQGIPVFSIISKGLFSADMVGMFPPSVIRDEVLGLLRKYFYVFLPSHNTKPLSKNYSTYFIDGTDYIEDLNIFREVAAKVLDEVQATTLVVTMASDTMEYIYGSRNLLKIIQSWMDKIKQLNGIMAIFQFGHETLKLPNHLAVSYFRLENIGGNIVFYGEIPRTKIYAAALDISDKYVQTRFIPIE
jgi:KaiC/GvpD/RAD55 family RecA-like ATPase